MFLTLLPYITAVANLLLLLGVLLTLSQRVRQLCVHRSRQELALQSETARLSAEIGELRGQILQIEQPDNSLAPAATSAGMAAAAGNSVNNTLRNKVLKMHRLGQSPDRIAGALRLPRGEVDLLVKVHKIVMRPYEEVVLTPVGAEKP
jgi:hypothetical protein